MKLLKRFLNRYLDQLIKNRIQLCFLGNRTDLPEDVRTLCEEVEGRTKLCPGMKLIVALNYGGRWEMVEAFKKMARKVETGQLKACDITEENTQDHLPSRGVLPFPHLIVRTGGVSRLSNFYLWQAAYSELYVTDVLWPDFNEVELNRALQFYAQTDRRFGTT